jgi:hypothetical protein
MLDTAGQDWEVLVVGYVSRFARDLRTAVNARHDLHVKHHLASARSKVGAATTAQLVWILAPRLPEPEGGGRSDD